MEDIIFEVVRCYGNKYKSSEHRRIDQRCRRGRNNKVIEADDTEQYNDIEITRTIVGVTRSREAEREEKRI